VGPAARWSTTSCCRRRLPEGEVSSGWCARSLVWASHTWHTQDSLRVPPCPGTARGRRGGRSCSAGFRPLGPPAPPGTHNISTDSEPGCTSFFSKPSTFTAPLVSTSASGPGYCAPTLKAWRLMLCVARSCASAGRLSGPAGQLLRPSLLRPPSPGLRPCPGSQTRPAHSHTRHQTSTIRKPPTVSANGTTGMKVHPLIIRESQHGARRNQDAVPGARRWRLGTRGS